jgi:CubicO group peptidase (beta-lactamase class C family)
MTKRILAAFPAVLLIAGAVSAQQSQSLVVGRTIDRTLGAGQAHSYPLTLDSARFVAGEAMQDGVDIRVAIVGPKGDTLSRFDSPNGKQGAEPFSFTTKARGAYKVVIAALEAGTSGRYTLTLKQVVAEAKTPAGKVEQLMANFTSNGPGVIAAVVRDGRIVYQEDWGLANLAHKIPFTVNTLTNIGSTSKQFTTFAILMLANQKKLSLDDDVRKHIPELPDFGKTITIRHLMTHTSGYREFLNALALTGRRIEFGDYIDRSEVIDMLKRQPTLQNDPGAEFNYNNSGFSLLSTIVERVGGKPFPEWMQENVFEPLGMKNTVIRATPGQVIGNSSQGYVRGAGGFREAQDIGASMGAGGIYTTLADLARWMRNFKTGTVGPPGFFQQMTTRNILTKGDTSSYGLGLFVDRWRGLQRVHHGGSDIAHRSAFFYFPELDAGVIVQSNNATVSPDQYAARIAEIFFADRLTAAAAALVATAGGATPLDSAKFAAYAGQYELQEMKGFIVTFRSRGGRYYTQATGQPELEILPTSDSTFKLVGVEAAVTFHREPDGSVKRLTLNQNGAHPAVRVGEAAPARPELAQFAGRYFSEELEAFFDVAAEGDTLMLRSRRTEPVKLEHQSGDTFRGAFPIASIKFERDATGKVTGLRAGNSRTRDVLFVKQN